MESLKAHSGKATMATAASSTRSRPRLIRPTTAESDASATTPPLSRTTTMTTTATATTANRPGWLAAHSADPAAASSRRPPPRRRSPSPTRALVDATMASTVAAMSSVSLSTTTISSSRHLVHDDDDDDQNDDLHQDAITQDKQASTAPRPMSGAVHDLAAYHRQLMATLSEMASHRPDATTTTSRPQSPRIPLHAPMSPPPTRTIIHDSCTVRIASAGPKPRNPASAPRIEHVRALLDRQKRETGSHSHPPAGLRLAGTTTHSAPHDFFASRPSPFVTSPCPTHDSSFLSPTSSSFPSTSTSPASSLSSLPSQSRVLYGCNGSQASSRRVITHAMAPLTAPITPSLSRPSSGGACIATSPMPTTSMPSSTSSYMDERRRQFLAQRATQRRGSEGERHVVLDFMDPELHLSRVAKSTRSGIQCPTVRSNSSPHPGCRRIDTKVDMDHVVNMVGWSDLAGIQP